MRITLLIIAGFLVTAGTGFFLLMQSIREDVARQYSQAAEEPLVDLSHLLASLVEQDLRDGQVDAREHASPVAVPVVEILDQVVDFDRCHGVSRSRGVGCAIRPCAIA